jgi:biotin carboxyl carrier protein
MLRLDMDLIRHALQTASDRGFASVEVGVGEDFFQANFQSRKKKPKNEPAPISAAPPETPTRTVTAPSVGYFRSVSSPLEIGQTIKVGDLIGEIVALGLKNDVVSKFEGTVVSIHATSNQPVEYGQLLVTLRV